MQGSYKTNGLPRPYYMKPHKRGVYENMARLNNLTNSRKLTGYLIMLILFGLCMFMIGQELKALPNSGYEIVGKNVPKNAPLAKNTDGDVKNFVQSDKNKDKVTEKDALSNGNKESLDEFDHVVSEAPKGGLVNEAPIVGNDAGLAIDGKKSSNNMAIDKNSGGNGVEIKKKGQSFSASREEDENDAAPPSPGKAVTPKGKQPEKNMQPEKNKQSEKNKQVEKNKQPDEEVKGKIIKKTKALDALREESKKKGASSEEAQKIIDETE